MSQNILMRLFTSTSTNTTQEIQSRSTLLAGTHKYMTYEVVINSIPREGHDTIGDPIDIIDSFHVSSCVIIKGTTPCNFLVNEEGSPIKTPQILGIF